MTNSNASSSVNRQRGAGLILVLIALAVGSMLITPTLNYVYTGLHETPIREKLLLEQYTADAAIEYALWQLEYNVDDITDLLSIDNPSSSSAITVNGMEVSLTTEISESPQSDSGAFTVPSSQSGIHLAVALDIRPPVWSKAGNKLYLTHMVYIFNYGTSAVHLKSMFQQLEPGLTYLQQSYEGPNADLTKTHAGDHWELSFDFKQPLPKVEAQEWMVISFTTWTLDDMGEQIYSGNGWVEYAAFQEDGVEVYAGDSGPSSVGLYDLTVSVGSYTLLVNAGVTEDGEVVIRSWQVE